MNEIDQYTQNRSFAELCILVLFNLDYLSEISGQEVVSGRIYKHNKIEKICKKFVKLHKNFEMLFIFSIKYVILYLTHLRKMSKRHKIPHYRHKL